MYRVCALTVVKTGQKTGPEQMKRDCEVLLTFYSIFLDVNYDSNNMLLVGKKKKKNSFWPLVGEDLKRF